jgi:DNA-binding transcriptional ArsR family regulator
MAKESFVLVSLREDKARKLAKVLNNESCRKILEHLTSKEATETELSSRLSIPISTVHYNLKHLVDAGLVVADEFHYSPKGREVNHYKLASKYIIIAPKSTFGIKERLKSALPVALLVGATAFAVQLLRGGAATFGAVKSEAAIGAARASQVPSQASPVWWFLGGALLAIALFVAYDIIKSRR